MSEKPKDGGPAFPAPIAVSACGDVYTTEFEGMTLRDWFAGQALAGMSANDAFNSDSWNTTAGHAYEAADAMIKARGGAE